jgi:hypothetical protein
VTSRWILNEDGSVTYDAVAPIRVKLIAAARELHGLGVSVEDRQKQISDELCKAAS